MTVEDQRGSLVDGDAGQDRFPVGMRVLAVDDDPICLKVLNTLLQKCQYHGLLPSCFYVFAFGFVEHVD
jgi:two-component response regulator (ARR-B family)